MNEKMKILLAYDGSSYAEAAIDDLKRAGLPREAEALIVSVGDVLMKPPPSSYEVVEQVLASRRVTSAIVQAQAQASKALEEAARLAAQAGERVRSLVPEWTVRAEALAGAPAQELIQKADEWKPDLIVVGSQGRSALGRLILGSVSKTVATDSRCSVRVARRAIEKSDDMAVRIIVGVDGSPTAERAVRAVGMRVWREGTEIRLISVDNGASPTRIASILPTAAAMIASDNEESAAKARQMIEWAKEELRAIGLNVSTEIIKGEPLRVLIEEARKWEADSIFVGSRGFSGTLERWRLGSVSTGLVTNAPCSVEVVRATEEIP